MIKRLIINILNVLYLKQIRNLIPKQTFFYLACGGSNMVLDAIIYAIIYNFVLDKQDIIIFGYVISAAIMSFFITVPIIFLTGFWLSKNISFTNSTNSNNKQRLRYLSVTISNILIKLFGLKLLIMINIWPSIANVSMTIVTVIFSYIMQRFYTFKGHKFEN